MKKAFSKIGLISKIELIENAHNNIQEVINTLIKNHCLIYTTPETKRSLEKHLDQDEEGIQPCSLAEMSTHIDLGIACGGDGTLMHLARTLIGTQIPIIGINYGRFGFLMDIKSDQVETQVEDILNGHYFIEQRLTLGVRTNIQKMGTQELAINDILIHRGVHSRLTEFLICIDGQALPPVRADGIIAASPTGSTGYSLSANGNITHPGLNAIILTPICSHDINITSRAIVLPGSSQIQISAPKNSVSVQIDGRVLHSIDAGETVEIFGEEGGLHMLHPQSYHYIARLMRRFSKDKD